MWILHTILIHNGEREGFTEGQSQPRELYNCKDWIKLNSKIIFKDKWMKLRTKVLAMPIKYLRLLS